MKKLIFKGYFHGDAEEVLFMLRNYGDRVEEFETDKCILINERVQDQTTQKFELTVSKS